MSCEIIQFSTAARVSLKRCKSIVRAAGTSRMSRVDLEQEPERPVRDDVELSTTCKNSRLRQMRDEAWNRPSDNELLASAPGLAYRARMGPETGIG